MSNQGCTSMADRRNDAPGMHACRRYAYELEQALCSVAQACPHANLFILTSPLKSHHCTIAVRSLILVMLFV